MKRALVFFMVVGLALASLGCRTTAPEGAAQKDTLSRILAAGKIRAGYFVQPPAVMKNPTTGELSGTFVEAIRAIANDLKVNVEFTEVDLAQFAAGLQTNAYDVSIGPTFRTIPRASSCAFTRSIFYLGYTGVVLKGRTKDFPQEANIDQPGMVVAVKEGSAVQRYAADNFKKAKVLVLSGTDLTLPLQAVTSGQANVGLMNEHTVEFYHRQHPEVEVVLEDKPIQVVGMSWAVRPGDLIWLNFLNTSLEFLEATGRMAEWERKYYFGRVLHHSMPTF